MRLAFPILLGTVAFGFTVWQAPQRPVAAARAAMEQADRDFCAAVGEKNTARFRTIIAEDATFYSAGGGEPARGREAVVSDWAPLLASDRKVVLRWEPKTAVVAASGELGFTLGEWERSAVDPQNAAAKGRGHYVTIWRKDPDGAWRALVDIGTASAPR
jgi:ketosteroid isomerase-like protein